MSIWQKIILVVFGSILLLSGIIRYFQTKDYKTAFTYDQARDMLDIRALGEFKDLAVLGPTTSINGLRLGPFYYYMNLPFYWLGRGDPQYLVYGNIIFFLLVGIIIFRYFFKKDLVLATIISSIYLMAPQMFNTTRYFWNANTATYLSGLYWLALWNFSIEKDKRSILFLGLAAGFLTQFEAAFGIVTILFSGFLIIIYKKTKASGYFLMGVMPWFLPQVALDIKNKFQMTKLLLGIFTGSNNVLGDKLTWIETIFSHWQTVRKFFEGQLMLPMNFGLIFLVVATIVVFINKKYLREEKAFVGFVIFAYVFYIVAYHHPLKEWYLDSLRVWYCFAIGMGVASLKKNNSIFIVCLGLLLISFWQTIKDQWRFTTISGSDDPKHLANLITDVDWVYQKMNGRGFEAYNFLPEIYDYPQQYLYWWYGRKKYGYMPGSVSYSLKEVPEYIRTQEDFYQDSKGSDNRIIALTYETTRDGYISWRNDFKDYCQKEKLVTYWRTTLEILEKCK